MDLLMAVQLFWVTFCAKQPVYNIPCSTHLDKLTQELTLLFQGAKYSPFDHDVFMAAVRAVMGVPGASGLGLHSPSWPGELGCQE